MKGISRQSGINKSESSPGPVLVIMVVIISIIYNIIRSSISNFNEVLYVICVSDFYQLFTKRCCERRVNLE